MGVSGCGKSSVGAGLAERLGIPYRDGDDLHPASNVDKMRAGVPLTSALSLVAEAVDNDFMADKIREMRRNIERGESLVRVSGQSNLFTPLVMQMLAVGEETGQVDDMLQEVALFYEREVAFDLKSLTAKIEPILIVIVAVMVLILALGIFTPMWDMLNAYKKGS